MKSAKKPASKKTTGAKKKAVKVKDLSPRKNPKGGNTDHPPRGGGKKSDY